MTTRPVGTSRERNLPRLPRTLRRPRRSLTPLPLQRRNTEGVIHENPDAYSHRALAWLDRERQRDELR